MVETFSLVDWFQSLLHDDDDGDDDDDDDDDDDNDDDDNNGEDDDDDDDDNSDDNCCCLFILQINIQVLQDMSKKWQCHCVGYQSTVSSMTYDMMHNSCSTVLSYVGLVHSLKQRIILSLQKYGDS